MRTRCSFIVLIISFIITQWQMISGMRYRWVTVLTRGDFIVSPHWEIRLLTPSHNIPQSYYPDTVLTSPCSILLTLNVKLDNVKYQFYTSLVWLGWELNSWPSTQETTDSAWYRGWVQRSDHWHVYLVCVGEHGLSCWNLYDRWSWARSAVGNLRDYLAPVKLAEGYAQGRHSLKLHGQWNTILP